MTTTLRQLVLIVLLVTVAAAQGLESHVSYAQGDEIAWLLSQINDLRASVGLPGYALNANLSGAAQAHSQWMADTGIVSHTQTNGSTPADRAYAFGYSGGWVSENIYGGMMADAQYAWNFWINSPIHYAGLTSATKNEVGIGIGSGQAGHFYTLVFGQGSGVSAPPPPPAQEPASGDPGAASQPPPPPTYPPITWTPSPTIPTRTPTITWTPTYTWTPTSQATQLPQHATSTPIDLAQLVTPLPTPTEIMLALAPANSADTDESEGPTLPRQVPLKFILPVLVFVQAILLTVAAWWLFLRKAS